MPCSLGSSSMEPTWSSMCASKRCGGIAFLRMTYRRPLGSTPLLTPGCSGSLSSASFAGDSSYSIRHRCDSRQCTFQCIALRGFITSGRRTGSATTSGSTASAAAPAGAASSLADADCATAPGAGFAATLAAPAVTCIVMSGTQPVPSQMLKESLISEGLCALSVAKAQPSGRPSVCGVNAHCFASLYRRYIAWLLGGSPNFWKTGRPFKVIACSSYSPQKGWPVDCPELTRMRAASGFLAGASHGARISTPSPCSSPPFFEKNSLIFFRMLSRVTRPLVRWLRRAFREDGAPASKKAAVAAPAAAVG
mmetsp:Transcript_87295/g.224847  ORF Transcript_87295/g.224847 Transcript_87295/m.224847 type:complete len:308 (-) Transcript_87295:258-1181(-)